MNLPNVVEKSLAHFDGHGFHFRWLKKNIIEDFDDSLAPDLVTEFDFGPFDQC